MKEGYDWRVVMNAMQTYVETGKKTYVICHCGAPTKAANFSDKRKKIVDRFNHWENVYTKMGITTWPIVLMGALPQDRKNENLKVLVTMGDNAKIVLEDTDDIDDALEIESSFAAA